MSSRKLYGDAKLIEGLLDRMQVVEESEGGWATVYKDTSSVAFWMKYYANSGMQSGGYEQLIKLPLPTTGELISIAINSSFEDEVVAAILRLQDEEAIEKKDFRYLLIKQLEDQCHSGISAAKRRKLLKLIVLTALDNPANKRDVLYKSLEQVEEDANYFKAIAERARLFALNL